MIEIISGTDRPQSNSLKVAHLVEGLFRKLGAEVQILDLNKLDLKDCAGGDYYKGPKGSYLEATERINRAEGVVFVIPEYNGSYPGALKLFVDYWRYPESFEHRPMAFVGLGTRWGGLRPVEHMQQVVGYRNAYVFPNRVFISNIKDVFRDGVIIDALVADLLQIQAQEFLRFVRGLQSEKLDANSRKAVPKK